MPNHNLSTCCKVIKKKKSVSLRPEMKTQPEPIHHQRKRQEKLAVVECCQSRPNTSSETFNEVHSLSSEPRVRWDPVGVPRVRSPTSCRCQQQKNFWQVPQIALVPCQPRNFRKKSPTQFASPRRSSFDAKEAEERRSRDRKECCRCVHCWLRKRSEDGQDTGHREACPLTQGLRRRVVVVGVLCVSVGPPFGPVFGILVVPDWPPVVGKVECLSRLPGGRVSALSLSHSGVKERCAGPSRARYRWVRGERRS